MKKIELRDFLDFCFLSDPMFNPAGNLCVFTVNQCDLERNGYKKSLWLSADGKVEQLPWEGAAFLTWLDDTHFLYKDKKPGDVSGPYSRLCSFDMETRTASQYAVVYLDVEEARALSDGRLILKSQCKRRMFEYCAWDEAKRAAALQWEQDNNNVIVFDEFPYCENGTGITNGMRRGLFLWDGEKTLPLTPSTMEVGAWDLSDDGRKVVLIGQDYEVDRKITSQLYELELESKTCSVLYGEDRYKISRVWYLDGEITFTATDGQRYGMMESDGFFTLKDGQPHLEMDFDLTLRMNVGTDSRFGKAEVVRKYGGKLYTCVCVRNATHLYSYCHGQMTPLYTQEGSIDGFAVGKDGFQLILMKDMRLEELYHMDWQGNLTCLSSFNRDWCDSHSIVMPHKVTVLSGGVEVDGWVLLPPDFDAGKHYPAILDIHGGPKTVYGEVYYHEMQVWANRGYVVFFCNPHGSDGRGNVFADVRKGYGDQDYRDIMAFTDKVLESYPQIDPKRVAVTGGSYGGFMTNWIIGHTNRFCCAASQRSISNWVTETISDSGHHFAVEQQFSDPTDCTHELWDYSPLRFVHRAVTPTLFIHSTEDYRCPVPEALQMFSALTNQGVPTRVCLFKGENHGLSRGGKPKNRIRRLEEITAWIDKYCMGTTGEWEWN